MFIPSIPQELATLTTDSLLEELNLPHLDDKPQNPIVDALRATAKPQTTRPFRRVQHSKVEENETPTLQTPALPQHEGEQEEEDMWTRAMRDSTREPRNRLINWDSFGKAKYRPPSASPFLTEQPAHVVAAIRYHVNPPLVQPNEEYRYITRSDIYAVLSSILVGSSSILFIWNADEERLYPGDQYPKGTCHLVIDELDAAASKSVLDTLSSIGTLFRRLEGIANSVLSSRPEPTSQSFGHSLSSIVSFVRSSLIKPIPRPPPHLVELLRMYSFERRVLNLLAQICNCDISSPRPYAPLPPSPEALLELIWTHVTSVIEFESDSRLRAIVAFMIERTSGHFIQTLHSDLGMKIGPSSGKQTEETPSPLASPSSPLLEEVEWDIESLDESRYEESSTPLPVFVSARVQKTLRAGISSLKILKLAKEELIPPNYFEGCRWEWGDGPSSREATPSPDPAPMDLDDPLVIFKLFDQEPQFRHALPPSFSRPPAITLESYLSRFPLTPSLTNPTLPLILSSTLSPLASRATQLSSALLSLYLAPAPGGLDLVAHLELSRSFLLMTCAGLREALGEGLFDDGSGRGKEERELESGVTIKKAKARADGSEEKNDIQLRAVGLSPSLIHKSRWPPKGSNLSSHLRNVIPKTIDRELASFIALGLDHEHVEVRRRRQKKKMWLRAEQRVGFVIGETELEANNGMGEGSDPLSISALDFLEMQYRPPPALRVILTESSMKKYRRIFLLLIRLMRLEAVSKRLQRIDHQFAGKILRTHPAALKGFRGLRFRIHAFVASFTSYVYDSAIRTHYDAFIDRLVSVRDGLSASSHRHGAHDHEGDAEDEDLHDIFQVSARHSTALDRIMTALLLRGPQKNMNARLTACMDVILAFGYLAVQMEEEVVGVEKAVEKIYYLSKQWRTNMLELVAALEKRSSTSMAIDGSLPSLSAQAQKSLEAMLDPRRRREDSMSELLTRIDADLYWRNLLKASRSAPPVHAERE